MHFTFLFPCALKCAAIYFHKWLKSMDILVDLPYAELNEILYLHEITGLYVDLTSGTRGFGLQSCQSITLV